MNEMEHADKIKSTFFSRLMVYLWETYPPPAALVLANLQFFCLYTLFFWINDAEKILVNGNALIGVLTCFLFMLFLRVADELKDREVDVTFFPERPLPSGRVLETDLWIVMVVIYELMFLLNTIFPAGILTFLALGLFAFFTFKYFFYPEYIAGSLLYSFLTHNPLTLMTAIYIISIPGNSFKLPIWRFEPLLLATWFWFFGIIWEFTRKIKAPEKETEYVTYSMLFGLKNSVFITLGLMYSQFLIIFYLSRQHPISDTALGLLAMVLLLCTIYFLLFVFRENRSNFKIMAAGAVYLFLNLVILLGEMLLSRILVWQ
ncbi:MAG: UbiA family prenyltransferase [Candidatus Riflebacteria bacterium]